MIIGDIVLKTGIYTYLGYTYKVTEKQVYKSVKYYPDKFELIADAYGIVSIAYRSVILIELDGLARVQ